MASSRKRGNSYEIIVSCGFVKGKRIQKRMTWTPDPNMTERQIQKELKKVEVLFEEQCKHGFTPAPVKFEELADEWLKKKASQKQKGTTYERTLQLRERIYAELGHLRLDQINHRVVQEFIDSLAEEGTNLKTGGRLSEKTIRHYLSFISSVMRYAIKKDIIAANPCCEIEIPESDEEEREPYTPEETRAILDSLNDVPLKYKAFVYLAAFTGCRKSELLGLEWKDFDFEAGNIDIIRASNYTKIKGTYTDTPKTKKSKRGLKISPSLEAVLKMFKAEQDKEREKLGELWVDNDRLFTKWNGEPMNPHTPYDWLKEHCEKNNLTFRGLHSFRHFKATQIADLINTDTAKTSLGHSDIRMTEKYVHIKYEKPAVAEAMEELLFPKNNVTA